MRAYQDVIGPEPVNVTVLVRIVIVILPNVVIYWLLAKISIFFHHVCRPEGPFTTNFKEFWEEFFVVEGRVNFFYQIFCLSPEIF